MLMLNDAFESTQHPQSVYLSACDVLTTESEWCELLVNCSSKQLTTAIKDESDTGSG